MAGGRHPSPILVARDEKEPDERVTERERERERERDLQRGTADRSEDLGLGTPKAG